MKKLLLVILLHVGLSFGQVTTPNLGMTWPAHLSANGTWDSNVVGNSNIIDNVFGISTCGDSTHAVGWDASQKKLTCQVIAGTGVGSAFSVIGAGTNTVALRMGTGGSLDTAGGTINASSLLNGTWAIPGPIGNTVPSSGAFTWLNSDQIIDAASFVGTGSNRWTDKVVAAYGSAACASGCTIVVPDSIADDGHATSLTIPSNVTVETTGSANFTACVINLGTYTKWRNLGDAKLTWSGTNCGMIGPSTPATLQTNDNLVIDHVRINCNAQVGANGIKILNGTAKFKLDTPDITGCTDTASAGLFISGGQFGQLLNVHSYLNYVGFKNYSTIGGGGNSNTCTNCTIVDNVVGYLQSDIIGNIGQGANVFVNSNILSSCIGAAIFGGTNQTFITFYGGSPEVNGSGTDGLACTVPLTIDSNVITTKATIFTSNARVSLDNMTNADSVSTPWASLNTNSVFNVHNFSGYGNTGGQLFLPDSTSSVQMDGFLGTTGISTGISSYPDTMTPGAITKLLGAPVYSLNPVVPNAYTSNPLNITLSDCLGGTASTASDALYGTVVTCAQAASSGSQDTNRMRISAPFGSPSGNQDYFVSFLVKSSVNVSYEIGWYGDNTSQAQPMNLVAGQWQRFVMLVGNKSSNYANTGLVGFPKDSSGPTISITGLEALAYPTGTLQAQQYFATVLKTGAVNPNGNSTFGTAWSALGPTGDPVFGLNSYTAAVANSPALHIAGSYQNAGTPTFAKDEWTFQNVIPGGTNPFVKLKLLHSGTSGGNDFDLSALGELDLPGTGFFTTSAGKMVGTWEATGNMFADSSLVINTAGAVGANATQTASGCESTFGITTLATGATTTDTGQNCLPANSIIDAVVYRITTTITTAVSFTIGDATIAGRFCGTQSTMTAGTTGVCFVQADQTGTSGPRQVSAAKIRVTTNANPGAGAIRLIVYYHTWTAPTS